MANAMRVPRECFAANCTRIGSVVNYCTDHASLSGIEGPVARRLRLIHQANQSKEAAQLRGEHYREPAWVKARKRRLKRLALAAKKRLRLNPWAKG
jgi:hypothetical protein